MIANKQFRDVMDTYISEVRHPKAINDIKYKGYFTLIFPVLMMEPNWMIEAPETPPFSKMHFQKTELEIVTSYHSGPSLYRTQIVFRMGNKGQRLDEFVIPSEAWGVAALKHHFRYLHQVYEENGLIRLTPEEEYQKEKTELMKKLYSNGYIQQPPPPPILKQQPISKEQADALEKMVNDQLKADQGEFDMGLLKSHLKQVKTGKWTVTDPSGNVTSMSNPDAGSQVYHNIVSMYNKLKEQETQKTGTVFMNLKQWTEKYFQEHGKFPEPEEFVGMKVAFDPAVPEGQAIYVNHNYFEQMDVMKGYKWNVGDPDPNQKPKPIYKYKNEKKAPKPTPYSKGGQNYDDSGKIMEQLIPALRHRGIPCPSPVDCPVTVEETKTYTLSSMIIHLNDQHQWPRSATDPNPYNKPTNIADWIDEICLLHNLDQSFHPRGGEPQTDYPPF